MGGHFRQAEKSIPYRKVDGDFWEPRDRSADKVDVGHLESVLRNRTRMQTGPTCATPLTTRMCFHGSETSILYCTWEIATLYRVWRLGELRVEKEGNCQLGQLRLGISSGECTHGLGSGS